MQPRTPLLLCVLLSQVRKRGCGAHLAPGFCIQIAWRGLGEGSFGGRGTLGRGGKKAWGSKGGHSQPRRCWGGGLVLLSHSRLPRCVCVHTFAGGGESSRVPPPLFFLQAGATFSPTSSGVTLIRLLRRLMHWRKTQLEATPRSRGFPQRSAEQGSAARVRIAGCWAGEAGLASPTSRGARAPSPSPAALWKAPPSRLPSAAARLLLSLKGAGSGRARSGVL